jgi:predicted ATPase
MIKRLYIDNYKCFVNFEYQPASLQLLFGANGTGKTTFFEVLTRLRDLVAGRKGAAESFAETLTVWEQRDQQRFELDIESGGRVYRYSLTTRHSQHSGVATIRVATEQLDCDGRRLYHFDGKKAEICAEHPASKRAFPLSPSRSGIGLIGDVPDSSIGEFRDLLERVQIVALDPLRMGSLADKEQKEPDTGLTDFASWYRHLAQDSPQLMHALFGALAEAIDGFVALKLTPVGGNARILDVLFRRSDGQPSRSDEFPIHFGALSHGQRCVIALFTLLHCVVRPDTTLCIDEPDNYIALREMQPWLAELADRVEDQKSQCLLISHHPEFIDLLAVKHGAFFTRAGQGPVRIKPFEWSEADAVRPSEIVARGWEE